MSKPSSGYFIGTQGQKNFFGNEKYIFIESVKDAEEIIAERVVGARHQGTQNQIQKVFI